MVILDGKQLQKKLMEEMKASYEKMRPKARLGIIIVGDNAASELFIQKKIAFGKSIGVGVDVYREIEDISTAQLCEQVRKISEESTINGIVVQLPLPKHIDTRKVLDTIPPKKDVDMLSVHTIQNYAEGDSVILPPVIGAVEAFVQEYSIDLNNKHVAIIGEGKLVGCPAVLWAERRGQSFAVISENISTPAETLKTADIVISGVGKANMITGDMVRKGVIIFDAGISTGGSKKVTGDIEFDSVSQKASFITPVPGGIGPVTVAIIFQNLLKLITQSK